MNQSIVKKIAAVLMIMLSVLIVLFFAARFGWRLFGFSLCENPSRVFLDEVVFQEDVTVIKVFTMSSAASYVGCTYEITDRVLYIGVRYNTIFGFLDRNGSGRIEATYTKIDFDKICLTDGRNEKILWEEEAY